jgi:hypothetical protein
MAHRTWWFDMIHDSLLELGVQQFPTVFGFCLLIEFDYSSMWLLSHARIAQIAFQRMNA